MVFCLDRRAMLSTLALLPASIAHAADEPAAIVEEAYRISAGPNGKWEGSSVLFDKKALPRLFSAAFVNAYRHTRALEAKSGGVILDFDPISSSQDPSVNDLSIKTERQDASSALVVARFHYDKKGGAWTIVDYDIRREGGDWKIDDIRGKADATAWSVRAIMRDAK